MGEVDYSRLIGRLEKVDYKGALAVDLLPEEVDPEERALELRKLRMLLENAAVEARAVKLVRLPAGP